LCYFSNVSYKNNEFQVIVAVIAPPPVLYTDLNLDIRASMSSRAAGWRWKGPKLQLLPCLEKKLENEGIRP
jgi:hypothetical protein